MELFYKKLEQIKNDNKNLKFIVINITNQEIFLQIRFRDRNGFLVKINKTYTDNQNLKSEITKLKKIIKNIKLWIKNYTKD